MRIQTDAGIVTEVEPVTLHGTTGYAVHGNPAEGFYPDEFVEVLPDPVPPKPGFCECGVDLRKPGAIYASTDGWYSYQAHIALAEDPFGYDAEPMLHVECPTMYLSSFQQLDEVCCSDCGARVDYDDDEMDGANPELLPDGTREAALDLLGQVANVEREGAFGDLASAVRALISAAEDLAGTLGIDPKTFEPKE